MLREITEPKNGWMGSKPVISGRGDLTRNAAIVKNVKNVGVRKGNVVDLSASCPVIDDKTSDMTTKVLILIL